MHQGFEITKSQFGGLQEIIKAIHLYKGYK